MDVDECFSAPCLNGGVCTDSGSPGKHDVPLGEFRCDCPVGFANAAPAEGRCEIDVDECESAPCENSAACIESSVSDRVGVDAFACLCR
eukprot:COSAG04_NODE_29863_length_266_cov_0.622754_1_plen_88_part_11